MYTSQIRKKPGVSLRYLIDSLGAIQDKLDSTKYICSEFTVYASEALNRLVIYGPDEKRAGFFDFETGELMFHDENYRGKVDTRSKPVED